MKKIKITEEQYKRLIISESVSKTDNSKNVFFGISMLMGIKLSGENKNIANNSLNDKEILEDIKSTFENEDKLKDLLVSLEEKGEKNPINKLKNNLDEIIKKFNEHSRKLDLGIKLGVITKQIVNTL